MTTTTEIKLFAERVERLCNRLAVGMKNGADRSAVFDLAQEAADIATMRVEDIELDVTLEGIAELIKR